MFSSLEAVSGLEKVEGTQERLFRPEGRERRQADFRAVFKENYARALKWDQVYLKDNQST